MGLYPRITWNLMVRKSFGMGSLKILSNSTENQLTDDEYSRILRKKMNSMGLKLFLVLIGFIPTMAGILYLSKLTGFDTEKVGMVSGLIYMAFILYCSLVYQYMECPKCNKTFFWHFVMNPSKEKFSFSLLRGRRCANCGLELKPHKTTLSNTK